MEWLLDSITVGHVVFYLLCGAVVMYIFGVINLRYERPMQLVVLVPWLVLQILFYIVIWPLFLMAALRNRLTKTWR